MSEDITDKKAQAREFFAQHARAYSLSPGHRSGDDLARLVELLAPDAPQRALDVATAAGHTAMALAPLVTEVVGVDITPEMQLEFSANAKSRGVSNVRFRNGDVEALPFPEAVFDIVTCRRAAHHFPNVPAGLAEIRRVLRPGGKVGIVDMVAPDATGAAELFNALERIRDASHVWAYRVSEWVEMLTETGLQVTACEVLEEVIPWSNWLYPVGSEPEAEAQFAAVLAAAHAEDREPVVEEGPEGRRFKKGRIVVVAVKPAS